MVEEWQLSAHDTAKRIMLRQCTRTVARTLAENKSSRIYIHGSEGTGKSAVLATIVASARTSGNIVLYMPDGARLSRHGYYVEPSTTLKGFYDLPILSQEVCTEFLESHEKDLAGFSIPEALKTKHFSRNHKKLIPEEQADDLTVVGLLKLGKEIAAIAPMCFSAVMEHLMEQDEKPFLIVMDDFNCYHDYSPNDYHYFHMNYDNNVKKPIPYELITLFKPGLEAMGIFHNVDMEELPGKPKPMKRGGAVVATTESHAIGRRFTDGLTDSAHYCAKHQYWESPIKIVEVPRYSLVECEHMISHYELIGVGKLRFDRGDTVMDENEIAYLQMVSGACGQAFLDACLEG
jgi:small subunit ribosomal protein S29